MKIWYSGGTPFDFYQSSLHVDVEQAFGVFVKKNWHFMVWRLLTPSTLLTLALNTSAGPLLCLLLFRSSRGGLCLYIRFRSASKHIHVAIRHGARHCLMRPVYRPLRVPRGACARGSRDPGARHRLHVRATDRGPVVDVVTSTVSPRGNVRTAAACSSTVESGDLERVQRATGERTKYLDNTAVVFSYMTW